jgi:long-chain fatty acid transport protein
MLLGLMRCGDLGVGSIKPKGIGLDLSFQAALYEDRTVSGNRNPTVDGTYRTTLYLGSGSIRMVF